MVNPYYIYTISFLITLLVYALGWSDLFPLLNLNLIYFLLTTIAGALFLGIAFQRKKIIGFWDVEYNSIIPKIILVILFLWVAEFIYNGGVPLILILRGAEYDYMKFGIPTLHVFVVTFTSFFSVFLLHVFLSTKRKKMLIYYCILMTMPLLLFNRGMLLINLVSSAFVYMQFVRRIPLRRIFMFGCLLVLALYFFGILGNIRTARNLNPNDESSSTPILQTCGATEAFINSPIPKEFFWSYLYIASPIGNFQYNIDINNQRNVTIRNFILFLNNEFIFDFISKRFDGFFGEERETCIKFIDSLSVASVYTNSFIYFGWIGLFLMGLFVIFFPIFYLGLIRKNTTFHVTATSILCSMYLFLIFDNMFAFTGLSFQLVYPLAFNRLYNLKFKK